MNPMLDGLLLIAAGLAAGIVNTLAGAGSLLTVPLLVLLGLPGNLANGTNRVGVVVHNVVATWRFRAEGVSGLRRALPLLLPVTLGSFAGAFVVSLISDELFEKLFGLLMVVLVIPVVFATGKPRPERSWPSWLSFVVFFGIGLFGGAFQAGVGLLIVAGLAHAGHDLLRANSIKVVINGFQTLVALSVFVLRNQVAWQPGLLLAIGYGLGGVVGVRMAVWGGERVIRVVLALAVVGLAGRMLGIW
jgi:uncharacterized membrane protein YfcA